MSKFCGNCGAELKNGARVCGQCGTPVKRGSAIRFGQKTAGSEKQEQNKKKKKLFAGLAGLAALVLAIVIVVNIVSNYTGCNGVLRKVMKAYESYDIDALVSLSSDVYSYRSKDWVESYFENRVGSNLDYFESQAGHNYKLSYEVKEVYALTKHKLDTELDQIRSSYPNFDIDCISQVKVADVKVTAKEGKASVSKSIQVTMTKEDGKWKLLYIE